MQSIRDTGGAREDMAANVLDNTGGAITSYNSEGINGAVAETLGTLLGQRSCPASSCV